jgi:hypothetical protein
MDGNDPYGQLHLLKQGRAEVWHGDTKVYHLEQPTLLFYPRSMAHRFVIDDVLGAVFVCAQLV